MINLNLEDLEILGAVLPSYKEVEYLTRAERSWSWPWWLRSSAPEEPRWGSVAGHFLGTIDYSRFPIATLIATRPALVIENLPDFNLKVKQQVKIEGLSEKFSEYMVLNNHLLFANFDIGKHTFNKDINKGNDYWTSDVKEAVDKWFEQNFTEQI